jgi:hypothetical protein
MHTRTAILPAIGLALLQGVGLAATVVVNDDSSTLHDPGCAVTGTGTCSLADAVAFANANAGADAIHFAIEGTGVHTIEGSFQITDAVTIDGYTQPGTSVNTNGPGLGDNAVLEIEVQGCFDVRNGPTTIRGLVINSCIGAGTAGAGILVRGTGTVEGPVFRTAIQGNFIGTDPTGTAARPNSVGIHVEPCETIVGAGLADSAAEAAAARNVVSGNSGNGVEITAGPILVAGNFIGTDVTGREALPNEVGIQTFSVSEDGCLGATGASGIGGASIHLRNVISGNHSGISIDESGGPIRGNFIGTDVSGSSAVPNSLGINVHSSSVAIGGDEPGAGNLISGNGGGIFGSGLFGVVSGNRIGSDVTGALPLGNGLGGLATDTGGRIANNLIAFNGAASASGAGVAFGANAFPFDGLALTGNLFVGNTSDGTVPDRGLGIDLSTEVDPDGPTANDDCDAESISGGMNFQNKPVLLGASSSSSGTRIQGYLNSKPSTDFHVEFFSNAACHPSGSGPGEVFLGSVEISTGDSCVGLIDVALPVDVPSDRFVTSTATETTPEDRFLNTSELSNCVPVAPATFDVRSLSPSSGPAAGAADVHVIGVGFVNGAGGQPDATASVGGSAVNVTGAIGSTAIVGDFPALSPGTLNDVVVTNPDSSTATLPKGWLADFSDVPASQEFHGAIERIFRKGITAGCGGGNFCPDAGVDRGQVAAFLARGLAGGDATKIPQAGTVNGVPYDCKAGGVSLFTDVAPTDPFCKHAHWIAAWEVTLGCSATAFCPGAAIDRRGMAGLVARALIAPDWMPVPSTYGPDPGTGRSYSCDAASPNVHFTDVPATDPFCKHVHYLWARGVVSGCAADLYCPGLPVTRGQMAKFLANTFVPSP